MRAGPGLSSLGAMDAAELYLELLKRALTGALYSTPPDRRDADQGRYQAHFVEHYFTRRLGHTAVPRVRLDDVHAAIDDVLRRGVPGDLVETGVWRGGLTILMRAVLKARGVGDRRVWAADSFEGLPEPDPVRFPREARAHHSPAIRDALENLAVPLEAVKENFERYGLLDDQVQFLVGWFADTLPTAPIEAIAVLRLDGDYYQSTWDALSALYDRVSPGGWVIVDDYGEDAWTYCRQAVDRFREERGITAPLEAVDPWCARWRKPD